METTSPPGTTRVVFIDADHIGYTAPAGWAVIGGFAAGENKDRFGSAILRAGIILCRVAAPVTATPPLDLVQAAADFVTNMGDVLVDDSPRTYRLRLTGYFQTLAAATARARGL